MNTLNYSNATNRNEHAFQLLFVPLESIILITYGAKLPNVDWLRWRAFSLINEGTFGNQEGMIT